MYNKTISKGQRNVRKGEQRHPRAIGVWNNDIIVTSEIKITIRMSSTITSPE